MPTTPDQPKNLYAKLAEVMAEIGHVPKRGKNTFHKYDYVMEADLVDAVRAKLAARNVVLIPSVTAVEERQTQGGKPSTITTVRVAFTFCDGDTGQTHTAEWAGAGDDPADKGLYKAYTGAVKYFLMKAFLIPTGDDPEADSRTDERSASQPTQRRVQEPVSDVPAPDLWFDATSERMKALGITVGKVRSMLEEIGVPVPEHVSSWRKVLTDLNDSRRGMVDVWLLEREQAGTPFEPAEVTS